MANPGPQEISTKWAEVPMAHLVGSEFQIAIQKVESEIPAASGFFQVRPSASEGLFGTARLTIIIDSTTYLVHTSYRCSSWQVEVESKIVDSAVDGQPDRARSESRADLAGRSRNFGFPDALRS